jgi:transcriptional regulator with XRE-family HTH domain
LGALGADKTEYGGWTGDEAEEGRAVILLRRLLGDALRTQRLRQERTLRDVSADARVSLGYLSEVERGQKEASSELLSSICDALGVPLSAVLREVSDELVSIETAAQRLKASPGLVPVHTFNGVDGMAPSSVSNVSALGEHAHDVVAAA